MIIIKEIKKGNKSVFKRIYSDNHGKVLFEDTINLNLYKIKKDGFDTLT